MARRIRWKGCGFLQRCRYRITRPFRTPSLLLEEKVPNFVRRMRWKGHGFFQRHWWCAVYPTAPHPSRRTAAPPSPQGEGSKSAQQILPRSSFHPRRALPPRAPPRLWHITPLPLTHPKTATTPQAKACGVASAYPRSIPPEAGLAPSGSPAALAHNSAALTHPKTATTPQAKDCGVASAYPRSIPSEAGLAPSGSPAALAHNSAALTHPKTATTPQAKDCGVASL